MYSVVFTCSLYQMFWHSG